MAEGKPPTQVTAQLAVPAVLSKVYAGFAARRKEFGFPSARRDARPSSCGTMSPLPLREELFPFLHGQTRPASRARASGGIFPPRPRGFSRSLGSGCQCHWNKASAANTGFSFRKRRNCSPPPTHPRWIHAGFFVFYTIF